MRPGLYRLGCPLTGRVVRYLGPAGDGYARVQSCGRLAVRWETLAARLWPLLSLN